MHAPAEAVERTPTVTERDRVREDQWQLRDHELSRERTPPRTGGRRSGPPSARFVPYEPRDGK